MTPENLSWNQLFTGDDIAFRIANPTPGDRPLNAEATCIRPDGSRQAAVGKVVGQQGMLRTPGIDDGAGRVPIRVGAEERHGHPARDRSRELTLQPYQNDQALAKRAVLALQEAMGEVKVVETDKGLRPRCIRSRWTSRKKPSLLHLCRPPRPVRRLLSANNWMPGRRHSMPGRSGRWPWPDVASSILADASDSQLVAFEGTTWENRDVDKQLPSEAAAPLRITRRCVPGEHEPVSIKLLNVTLDTVLVGARVETEPGGPSVTAHEVKSVPTNQDTTAWDPIVPVRRRQDGDPLP